MFSDFYSYEEPSVSENITKLKATLECLRRTSREKQIELEQLKKEISDRESESPESLDAELEEIKNRIARTDKYKEAIKPIFASLLSDMSLREVKRMFSALQILSASVVPEKDQVDYFRRTPEQMDYFKVSFLFPGRIVEIDIPRRAAGFKEYLKIKRW
jgi:hypothetical protein